MTGSERPLHAICCSGLLLAAAAAGWVHGLTPDEIREGLLRTETLKGRFRTITTEKFTIFDDSYNASPASVEAALELLKVAEGRKAAVLGDMGELGGEAPRFHREVGAYAAAEGRTDHGNDRRDLL